MYVPALLVASLACTQVLTAQTIRGTLLDDMTGQRIWAGTVTLLAEDSAEVAAARTDRGGRFTLHADGSGAYRLRAERPGFTTAVSSVMELKEADTLHVQFLLSRRALVLDPIVVRGQPSRIPGPLGDYYKRLENLPWGRFVTRDEIDRRPAARATDLLRHIPGVQLDRAPRSSGNRVILRGTCSPAVFLDGTRIPLAGMTIDDLVAPSMLEGIEVYRNAIEVPAQYGLNVGCGAILLWTRRGG